MHNIFSTFSIWLSPTFKGLQNLHLVTTSIVDSIKLAQE